MPQDKLPTVTSLSITTRQEQRVIERAFLAAAHQKETQATKAGTAVEIGQLMADAHLLRKLAAQVQL